MFGNPDLTGYNDSTAEARARQGMSGAGRIVSEKSQTTTLELAQQFLKAPEEVCELTKTGTGRVSERAQRRESGRWM